MDKEKKLQRQKIEENVKHLEKKLYETEDMIRKYHKEADLLTQKLCEKENENKQKEILKLKASIPDFDEETYLELTALKKTRDEMLLAAEADI